jgi:hypothetical protein
VTASESQSENPESDPQADAFYSGAYRRILRVMAVIGCAFTVAIWIKAGYRVGLGFGIGCGIAGLNFYWMERSINAFAERVIQPNAVEMSSGSSRGGARFVLRYALLATVAYVIFKSSLVSLSGLLAGLFLPVAAILVEAIYETFVALRRGL